MFGPRAGVASENGGTGTMEKGPFSVEWLAQSSRGGARPAERPLSCGDSGAAPAVPGPQQREAEGGPAAGRPRTKFSAAQLQELERSFREQRYIGASEKRRLAAALSLSQSQIKTWFQNRRMKFKRETQDARVEALVSGLFLPYRCYPDAVPHSCAHGADINVPSTPGAALPRPVPGPALLLPPGPVQPLLPGPALLLPPGPGLPACPALIPAVTLTGDHKGLRFQPYLHSC